MGTLFWVYKFKGNRVTLTPPWEPVTKQETPGPTYLTDVAGWPESRHQRHAKRFRSRRAARDFPRALPGAVLVRVRRRSN